MKFLLKISPILFCLMSSSIHTQTMLHVVSKHIEKTFPYENGIEVNIEGEKAEIKVETWEKNEVMVLTELISKTP